MFKQLHLVQGVVYDHIKAPVTSRAKTCMDAPILRAKHLRAHVSQVKRGSENVDTTEKENKKRLRH